MHIRSITTGRREWNDPRGAAVPRERIWLAVVAVLVLALPTAAFGQSADDARKQAEQYEQQADAAEARAQRLAQKTDQVEARVAKIVDRVSRVEQRLVAARDHADRVEQKLEAAGRVLEAAELAADKAENRAERARLRSERADADLAAKRDELQVNEDERASVVRDAYMYGPGVASPELAVLHMAESSTPTDVADVLHMLDVVLVDHGLLVDTSVRLAEESEILATRAQDARAEREREFAAADAAREEAASKHAEVLVLMGEAEQAVAEEQDAIAALQTQQEAAQRQINQLTRARAQAEGEVARRTEQAKEAAQRAERLAAEAAAAAAAAAARAVPPAPAGVSVSPVTGGLSRVGGITVASSIASQVQAPARGRPRRRHRARRVRVPLGGDHHPAAPRQRLPRRVDLPAVVVPRAHRTPRHLDARTRAGDRLHLERAHAVLPELPVTLLRQPGLRLAAGPRVPVRAVRAVHRGVALLDQRPLSATGAHHGRRSVSLARALGHGAG